MFMPLWIAVVALAGILLTTLGVGTAVNALVARWHNSQASAKDGARKTWTHFLTGNIAAIIIAAFVFYYVFGVVALAGRTLLGVVDLPGGGPPGPGFGGGGPPAWYPLLLCLLIAIAAGVLTDVLVFLHFYRRR